MSLKVGAPAKITFLFRNTEDRDGIAVDLGPLNLSTLDAAPTATLVKPRDGERLENLALDIEDAAAGQASVTLTTEQVDTAGSWRAQGTADGFASDVVTFPVESQL